MNIVYDIYYILLTYVDDIWYILLGSTRSVLDNSKVYESKYYQVSYKHNYFKIKYNNCSNETTVTHPKPVTDMA